jgi:hypothetical protein
MLHAIGGLDKPVLREDTMQWNAQYDVNGPVEYFPHESADAEESEILRIAIGVFVDYLEVVCLFGIQHENANISC